MPFVNLRLADPILKAVASQGYEIATPIQAQTIPHVMEGRDVLGCAQTGTGKTAAFALPILHRMHNAPALHKLRCLVLAPTRELATQISHDFIAYGKNLPLRHGVIYGGVNQKPQVQMLRNGAEIVIATPGRLLDLMNQGHVDLKHVEFLVLDEADRMLDMGFIHDIRRIITKLPANRQTLFFSATMPPEIRKLSDSILRNPVSVHVAHDNATAARIEQSVYFVDRQNKSALLAHLFEHLPMARAIVFTRTKHGADKVVKHLHASGIRAEAIHGNKSQNVRQRALQNFRNSKTPILVATDIASRGIDIDDISHVVNYDLTHEPETYVHRIGRTARAGASGAAVSFCDHEERGNLKAIEKLLRQSIPVVTDHPHAVAGKTDHRSPNSNAHAPKIKHEREPGPRKHDHTERDRAGGQPPRNGGNANRGGGQSHRPGGQPHRPGGNSNRAAGQPHRSGGNSNHSGGNSNSAGGNSHATRARHPGAANRPARRRRRF